MKEYKKSADRSTKSYAQDKHARGSKTSSRNGYGSPRKAGTPQGKPYYQTKLQGHTGARPGDYVIISDGKQEITTRVNLSSHPFCKKNVGDTVTIKAVQWTLIRILYQGTDAYHKVFDADTQREHFGY